MPSYAYRWYSKFLTSKSQCLTIGIADIAPGSKVEEQINVADRHGAPRQRAPTLVINDVACHTDIFTWTNANSQLTVMPYKILLVGTRYVLQHMSTLPAPGPDFNVIAINRAEPKAGVLRGPLSTSGNSAQFGSSLTNLSYKVIVSVKVPKRRKNKQKIR